MSKQGAVHVAVGILVQPDQRLLLASRPADKPWSHWWELPGGKIEPGESAQQALTRELQEELNIIIDLKHTSHWRTTHYHYPSGTVKLEFFLVHQWSGTLRPLEGQQIAWVRPDNLADIGPILPATLPILRWLNLPNRYLLSNAMKLGPAQWLQRLEATLSFHPYLVQFREPQWQQQAQTDKQADNALYDCYQETLALCRHYQAPCLVNSIHPQSWWLQADGVHLRSQDAQDLSTLPNRLYTVQSHFGLSTQHLVGVSTHTAQELRIAAHLQADFAVLGHVLDTESHPNEPALGWPQFKILCEQVELPIYAIGGQSNATLTTALQHAAHGIAGITKLLAPLNQG